MWKAVSSIENGHKAAVTQIEWVPAGLQATKNGVWEKVAEKEPVQIFTTSTDGSYAIWDMRPPPVKKSMTQLKKKKLAEQDPLELDPWAHLNLVWKPLLKATLSKGVLLTVGGSNFSIWKESEEQAIAKIPLLSVHSNDKKYTAGEWSPTRPGLILMATDEGNIEVWDLLEKTHEPNVNASIINSKLHLLAVSDSCGTLHILELPWNLRHPTNNEKSSVQGYIHREEQRILYFDEADEHEASENLTLAADADHLENILDDELENEFKDYLKLEKEINESLTV
ncbi:unnamed protein product [Oikopleura dioica]|uniref:Uncharacterized protein n=1 Tax=Oikopleura dioica TaxID=34765 RepID=E4XSX4_OIKDI|nr:unnamed protein product [Oikopleura dioica]